MGARFAVCGSVAPLAMLVCASVPCFGQVAKLNGPLARPTVGDVTDYLVAPDAPIAVFRANLAGPYTYELFAAPIDGSAPALRLNDPLPAGANVGGSAINIFGAGGWDYALAPGGHVLFLVDNTDGVDELYSVPIDRSAPPVRVNGPLVSGGDVGVFSITPDGQHVVYLAAEVTGGRLFRAPIDGSAPATPLAPGLAVGRMWLSPDGTQVAFTVPISFGAREELYSVSADGSAAPRYLGVTPLPSGFAVTYVQRLRISADNTWIACEVADDEDGDIRSDLFGLRLDGSDDPTRLNLAQVFGFSDFFFDGQDRVLFFEAGELVSAQVDGGGRTLLLPAGLGTDGSLSLSADGGTVVFGASTLGQRALYRAPSDGSSAAEALFPPLATAIGLHGITGANVVWSTVVGTSWQLHSVPLAGGTPVLLSPPPFDTGTAGLVLHPGGADTVFRAQGGTPGMMRLFATALDGLTPPRLLNGPLIAAGDVLDFALGDGGQSIAYRADATNNESFELFGVPFAGGPVARLSPPLVPGPVLGDVEAFRVTADGERVLYLADQDEDDALGLYLARSDARGDPRRLDAGLPETTDVFDGFGTSADGRHIVFLKATSPGSANGHLYAVDLATGGTPRLLDATTAKYEQELVLDPQATRVFYIGRRTFTSGWDLLTARLDGSVPPDVLNLPAGAVDAFRVTPDGATVVYRSTQDTAGVPELYRVAADGSTGPQKLSTPPVAGGGVTAFELTPDGARVLYLSDRDVDNVFELYAVPSDASAPALELNPPLVAGGDVTNFLVTPDSAFVVYRADQADDQTFELYRVPIGGGAAVALTALPTDRAVQADFVLAPDGQTVFFRANLAGNGLQELFRVPADGSAAPVVLSGVMVTGGSVDAFALALDGTRLAFLADGRVDGVKELWSVLVTGGTPLLLHTLPATGDVDTFRIAPDSQLVFHRADALVDGVLELFVAPLDGSAPARRLNAALPSGADVENDFVALTAGRVVFRADQEETNVLELFMAFPGSRGALQAPTPTQLRSIVR